MFQFTFAIMLILQLQYKLLSTPSMVLHRFRLKQSQWGAQRVQMEARKIHMGAKRLQMDAQRVPTNENVNKQPNAKHNTNNETPRKQ